MDHLNYEKGLINKFLELDEESQSNSIDEEGKLLKAIANLLDLNLIKNLWSSTKENNKKNLMTLYKNLGAGYYLGSWPSNKEEQNQSQKLL